jgi:two-component system, OmpR family, sensor histidine kinase KdpD
MPIQLQRQLYRIWLSMMLVVVATLASFLIAKLGTTDIVMLYLLAVIATSYYLGFLAAIIAAISSFLSINFFFIEPRYTFEVANSESWAALLGFLAVSIVVASLVKRLQFQTYQAEQARQQAEFARELAEQLSELHDEDKVLDAGCHLIHRATNMPTGIAMPDLHGEIFSLAHEYPADIVKFDHRAAKWCCQNGKMIGPGGNNWPESSTLVMPFVRLPGVFPILVVMHSSTVKAEFQVTYLRGLLDQVAMAYQRVRNEKRAKDAERQAQEESFQNALLASVSHDMRTPLTAILGAATTLIGQRAALDEREQIKLLESISTEVRYLANSTENILFLTRLESIGNHGVPLDWQSPEEIVGAVLRRYHNRTLQHELRSKVPQGIPLVQADDVLLAQALGNLIDNALAFHHGTEPILVGAELRGSSVVFYVRDRGNRFPENFRAEHIRKFQRMSTRSKGMGLGLAIVKTIAQLHLAELHIERREGGGTSVEVEFPARRVGGGI